MRLVDTVTIPMLLNTVQAKRIDAGQLINHHVNLTPILEALVRSARGCVGHRTDHVLVRAHAEQESVLLRRQRHF